jgi:hypothetical protein
VQLGGSEIVATTASALGRTFTMEVIKTHLRLRLAAAIIETTAVNRDECHDYNNSQEDLDFVIETGEGRMNPNHLLVDAL